MYKYLLVALMGVVLVGLVGPAQAYVSANYWGHNGTPVSNYWHNASNWSVLGIPTSVHFASIRSERGYE